MNLTTIDQREKAAQFMWTGFILVFFSVQAVIWTVAIAFTAADKSHAVVAGYDERALEWDQEIARRNASSQLGWQVTLSVDPVGDIRDIHGITVQLNDGDNLPITGATVELTAFHRAYAGAPQRLIFTEIHSGVYAGNMAIRRSGLWEFEGQARKGDSLFLIHEQQALRVSQ